MLGITPEYVAEEYRPLDCEVHFKTPSQLIAEATLHILTSVSVTNNGRRDLYSSPVRETRVGQCDVHPVFRSERREWSIESGVGPLL